MVDVYFKGEAVWLTQKTLSEDEYVVFRKRQDRDYISDFDREIKPLEGKA